MLDPRVHLVLAGVKGQHPHLPLLSDGVRGKGGGKVQRGPCQTRGVQSHIYQAHFDRGGVQIRHEDAGRLALGRVREVAERAEGPELLPSAVEPTERDSELREEEGVVI